MATIWYLWAVNDNPGTNEYLVKVIGESNEEEYISEKLCTDKKKRNLFRCPAGYANVQSVIAARIAYNLKFEVFKEDIKGVITPYVLWKGKLKKAAKAMRVNKALKNRTGHNARFVKVN